MRTLLVFIGALSAEGFFGFSMGSVSHGHGYEPRQNAIPSYSFFFLVRLLELVFSYGVTSLSVFMFLLFQIPYVWVYILLRTFSGDTLRGRKHRDEPPDSP